LAAMFAFVYSSCGRKPEYLEETHLPALVKFDFRSILNTCINLHSIIEVILGKFCVTASALWRTTC